MELINCGKGHFYDPNVYSSCPQCAEEMRGGGVDGYGATQPVFGGSSGGTNAGVTAPVTGPAPGGFNGATMPPTEAGGFATGTGYAFTENGTSGVEQYGQTTPVSLFKDDSDENGSHLNPVVGWLVCVSGPNKGGDYRIHNGYNYIGRSDSMDICIQGDNYISNEKAAMISYDDEEKEFFFGPGDGHNAVRVNGKMIHTPVLIRAYDEVKIGKSLFRFVPFCEERFDWNE